MSRKQLSRALLKLYEDHIENTKSNLDNINNLTFIDAIRKYAVTDRGESVKLTNILEEYGSLIADLDIRETLTDGCAQNSKAQPLTSKILTPKGWRTMGDIAIGDDVITPDGKSSKVIGVFPQGIKKIYRVTMNDGGSTECCDDHLWLTQTNKDRSAKVKNPDEFNVTTRQRKWLPLENGTRPGTIKTLSEIKNSLKIEHKKSKKLSNNHSIPIINPVENNINDNLPIHPYILGILIGDGCLSIKNRCTFSTPDEHILNKIKNLLPNDLQVKKINNKYDYCIKTYLKGYHLRQGNPFINRLNELGLMGHKSNTKFIPQIYLNSSLSNRYELLQGLMDSDGSINKNGDIKFDTSSYQLIKDIKQLIWSIGGITRKEKCRQCFYTYKNIKKQGLDSYSIYFRLRDNNKAFTLPKKLNRCKKHNPRLYYRYIEKVEYVGDKEAKCILIDHPDHLYITDDYIVTHNTLIHNLLLIYLIIHRQFNTLWVYSQERVMQRMVKIQFKPMIESWLENLEENIGNPGSKATNLYQIGRANAIFSYSSTSKQQTDKQTAAAGSSMVSFSADIAFLEERSQWQPGTDAPVYRRLDYSRIPSKPIRQLGTNGSYGTGIHEAMEDCTHEFNPHCICENCGNEIDLHPNKTLLQPIITTKPNGETIKKYLGNNGKPVKWFYKDENDPVKTAYFGCYHCNHPISNQQRIYKSYFKCIKTGLTAKEFLKLDKSTKIESKVAIHLFPTIKPSETNLASFIISEGLKSSNPADWCEQQLGIPSQSEVVKITKEMIKTVLASPMPEYTPPGKNKFDKGSHRKVTLMGVDCGRSSHWGWICSYYVPHDTYRQNNNEISDRTIRVLEWCGDIVKSDIPDFIKQYNVEFGIIDNEPDIESSARLCEITPLEMADQKDRLLEEYKKATAIDGGEEYPVYRIRNQKFLRQVLNIFSNYAYDGYPLIRIRDGSSWEKWFNVSSNTSPIKHLTSVVYDHDTNKFKRPDDKIDDIYFAAAFCESSFFIWLENKPKLSMWS